MIKPHPVFLVATVLILIVGVTYAIKHARSNELIGVPFGSGSQQATYEDILKTQAEILARLERLELTIPSSRDTRPQAASGGRPAGLKGNGKSMTAAEIAASQASIMHSLDNKFIEEPLSAAWASKTERTISSALSANALGKEQAIAPKSMQSKCRSQTCRISMEFTDGLQADFTKGIFLQGIAENLPKAQIFLQERADGSVSYVIYAQTSGSAGPRI